MERAPTEEEAVSSRSWGALLLRWGRESGYIMLCYVIGGGRAAVGSRGPAAA